ncbi:hypothetical protein [Novosphingobium fuchskuhlense]|nr:hypothetical protein [Novosphingobium fuchskuhlense]
MTAPFDWAGLWNEAHQMWADERGAADIANHLRTRIEAAFVPVERHAAQLVVQSLLRANATTRAEAAEAVADDVHKALWAAEARVKALEEALLPFARIADHNNRLPKGASVGVNIDRCRDARQALGGDHEHG